MGKGNYPIIDIFQMTTTPKGLKNRKIGSIFRNKSQNGNKYYTIVFHQFYLYAKPSIKKKALEKELETIKELVVVDESKSSDQ